jgi:hypothetical protein
MKTKKKTIYGAMKKGGKLYQRGELIMTQLKRLSAERPL